MLFGILIALAVVGLLATSKQAGAETAAPASPAAYVGFTDFILNPDRNPRQEDVVKSSPAPWQSFAPAPPVVISGVVSILNPILVTAPPAAPPSGVSGSGTGTSGPSGPLADPGAGNLSGGIGKISGGDLFVI